MDRCRQSRREQRTGADAAWWKNLHDPILDTLVFTAYRQNLTLRAAAMRILQARHSAALSPAICSRKRSRLPVRIPVTILAECLYFHRRARAQLRRLERRCKSRLGDRLLGLLSPRGGSGRREPRRLGGELRRRARVVSFRSCSAIRRRTHGRAAVGVRPAERRHPETGSESGDREVYQRRHHEARRDPRRVEPRANGGHDSAVGNGPPPGRQPDLHFAGHASARHRRSARRPQADSRGFPAGGIGNPCGPVAAAPNVRSAERQVAAQAQIGIAAASFILISPSRAAFSTTPRTSRTSSAPTRSVEALVRRSIGTF